MTKSRWIVAIAGVGVVAAASLGAGSAMASPDGGASVERPVPFPKVNERADRPGDRNDGKSEGRGDGKSEGRGDGKSDGRGDGKPGPQTGTKDVRWAPKPTRSEDDCHRLDGGRDWAGRGVRDDRRKGDHGTKGDHGKPQSKPAPVVVHHHGHDWRDEGAHHGSFEHGYALARRGKVAPVKVVPARVVPGKGDPCAVKPVVLEVKQGKRGAKILVVKFVKGECRKDHHGKAVFWTSGDSTKWRQIGQKDCDRDGTYKLEFRGPKGAFVRAEVKHDRDPKKAFRAHDVRL